MPCHCYLNIVTKFCTLFLEGVSSTCGGNTGNEENRCGGCERLGNIEDDVLSRGSVCNIPQLVRLLSRSFLSVRFLYLDHLGNATQREIMGAMTLLGGESKDGL